jgi:hypothetical protein
MKYAHSNRYIENNRYQTCTRHTMTAEVPTAVLMNILLLWNVMPPSLVDSYQLPVTLY